MVHDTIPININYTMGIRGRVAKGKKGADERRGGEREEGGVSFWKLISSLYLLDILLIRRKAKGIQKI